MFTLKRLCLCLLLLPALWPGVARADELRRVAVVAFENRSPDPAYLSTALAESCERGLVGRSELVVLQRLNMARLLSEQHFGQSGYVAPESAPRLGALLGAQLLVSGSFQRAGGERLVNVQLLEAASGQILHAFSLRAPGEPLFDFQAQLTRRCAQEFQFLSRAAPPDPTPASAPVLSAAYARYLQGRQSFFQATPDSWQQALSCFEQATTLDPNFAPAWAATAETLALLGTGLRRQGDPAAGPYLTRSLAAAATALRLNPRLAEAYRAQAHAYNAHEPRQQAAAVQAAEQALRLSPRDPEALYILAAARGGDVALYQQALALNPHFILARNDLGYAYLKQGQTAQAAAQFQALADRGLPEGRSGLLEVALSEQDWQAAAALFPAVLAASGRSAELHYRFAVTLQRVQQEAAALEQARAALRENPRHAEALLLAGLLCVSRCAPAQTRDLLQRYLALNPGRRGAEIDHIHALLED